MKKNSHKIFFKYYYFKNNALGKGKPILSNKIDRRGYFFNKYMFYFFRGSDIIIRGASGNFFFINNGKYWISVRVNRWFVGYKVGSFSWNRKRVKFKKKIKKKK